MSNLEIGLASFPALLILIFIRVPIGLAMFFGGFGGAIFHHRQFQFAAGPLEV